MSYEQMEMAKQLQRIADALTKPTVTYHDTHSARTWVEDEVLEDLRQQANRARHLNHKVSQLKARIHEVIAECWKHADKVKELEGIVKQQARIIQNQRGKLRDTYICPHCFKEWDRRLFVHRIAFRCKCGRLLLGGK